MRLGGGCLFPFKSIAFRQHRGIATPVFAGGSGTRWFALPYPAARQHS